LVHSSTLVTAGVYLLIRFRDLIQDFKILRVLIYLGVLTTLMSRLRALFEPDFKKVVALSTLSQLGIIVITLSIGFGKLAFIHLLTHAVFKALLFICRGKVIHSVGDYQDARKIGGEIFNLPITRAIIVLSRYALCGVPFLSGFYSKDIIIESSLMGDIFFFNYCLYILIVGLSSSYSFRILFLSIIRFTNQNVSLIRDEED
jgi:NADH-ubiquinone oxidoreductase chain 5